MTETVLERPAEDLHRRVLAARESGISRRELASESGLSEYRIWKIEKSGVRPDDARPIRAALDALEEPEPPPRRHDPVFGQTPHTIMITAEDGTETSFVGVKLGSGTSNRDGHSHPPNLPPARGRRCSGCRWTEVDIFWDITQGMYVVQVIGRSILPGEIDKIRHVWTKSPDEVLDALLVRPPRRLVEAGVRDEDELELPLPNWDALESASRHDAKLATVFRRWEEDGD